MLYWCVSARERPKTKMTGKSLFLLQTERMVQGNQTAYTMKSKLDF